MVAKVNGHCLLACTSVPISNALTTDALLVRASLLSDADNTIGTHRINARFMTISGVGVSAFNILASSILFD